MELVRPLSAEERQWLADHDYEPPENTAEPTDWDMAPTWLTILDPRVGVDLRLGIDVELHRWQDSNWTAHGRGQSTIKQPSPRRAYIVERVTRARENTMDWEDIPEDAPIHDEETGARMAELGFKDIGGGDWAEAAKSGTGLGTRCGYIWHYGPRLSGFDYRDTDEWHPQLVGGGTTEGPPMPDPISAAVWLKIQDGAS